MHCDGGADYGSARIVRCMIGYTIASGMRPDKKNEQQGLVGAILILPLFGALETRLQPVPTFEILTTIDIATAPELVWRNVVEFSDITAEPAWYFRLGISTPLHEN